jgi:hypothetical protein
MISNAPPKFGSLFWSIVKRQDRWSFQSSVSQTFSGYRPLSSIYSFPLLPCPINSILQNSGLHRPLMITIKQDTAFSNCFTVSTFLMRWMGVMKWYQFPKVWSKVTSIVNRRIARSEGYTSSASLPLSAHLGEPLLQTHGSGRIVGFKGVYNIRIWMASAFAVVCHVTALLL